MTKPRRDPPGAFSAPATAKSGGAVLTSSGVSVVPGGSVSSPPFEPGGSAFAPPFEAQTAPSTPEAERAQVAYPACVLSHVQLTPLWQARSEGKPTARMSLDLGMSETDVALDSSSVHLPNGSSLTWEQLESIENETNVCFTVDGGDMAPIRRFSEDSRRVFQLMPTTNAPAMLIAGFTMHRLRDVGPVQGAAAMVRALSPLRGHLLDTTTGLGYAAIEAAKYAAHVTTVELDPMARAMAQLNPWSRALFERPNITSLLGNSAEVITTFEDASFTAVLHDPPAVNLAGELYAESFYAQVFRVLSPTGRFFHYIGDPQSSSGSRTTKGVARRLLAAGFSKVVAKPDAFGLLALKRS